MKVFKSLFFKLISWILRGMYITLFSFKSFWWSVFWNRLLIISFSVLSRASMSLASPLSSGIDCLQLKFASLSYLSLLVYSSLNESCMIWLLAPTYLRSLFLSLCRFSPKNLRNYIGLNSLFPVTFEFRFKEYDGFIILAGVLSLSWPINSSFIELIILT